MYEKEKNINIKSKIILMAVIKSFRIKSFKKLKPIIEFNDISLFMKQIDP